MEQKIIFIILLILGIASLIFWLTCFFFCRQRFVRVLSYFCDIFLRVNNCIRSCCGRTADGEVKFLISLRNLFRRERTNAEMTIIHLPNKEAGEGGQEFRLANGAKAKFLPLSSSSTLRSLRQMTQRRGLPLNDRKPEEKPEKDQEKNDKDGEDKGKGVEEAEEEEDVSGDSSTNQIVSNRVTREHLEGYLNHVVRRGDLASEFKSIPTVFKRSTGIFGVPSNRPKNRYKNNILYDDTRVVLQGKEGSDYINASFVEGFRETGAYIATQGPKDYSDSTIEDFWRMIWEQHCNTVVMLACLIEGGKVKVAQYWPDLTKKTVIYGEFSISIVSEQKELDYFIRKFTLTHGDESREVTQYQFIAWPDHNVPQAPFTFSLMIMEIRRRKITGPLLVHCSAGIGRTGTLLLVLVLLDQLDNVGYIDAPSAVALLRQGRPLLVENQMQYRFAHQLLLEILYSDVTNYPVSDFVDMLPRMDNEMREQYKKLKGTERNLSFKWALKPAHAKFNRNPKILPVDGRQVFLQMVNGKGESQYINAIYLNSVTQRDAMIALEHPLRDTLAQAWRMMYERKVSAWVVLNTYDEDKVENFPAVLPKDDLDLGFITLTLEGVSRNAHCQESQVTLTPIKSRFAVSHSMKVIQLYGWPFGSEFPDDTTALLALLEDVHEIRRKAPSSPVVFTCGDGCTASGLAAALDVILTRIELLRDVDVYRAVQALLYERPQFITSFEQYKFLFRATAERIQMKPKEEEARETMINE
ncbi:receptor-type tyrosine-protein phosphatase S-like [Penaeus japonicus]|uniref:receptor-type tyrosine-protein phosphatase S-like n=1 Tax=Penaeus japonicus TaxID=27405 RepID=UPI001C7106EA|nr:receptor-type tyrosine-protein phosphatase S-like [Penaeus japonicus]